MTSQEIMSRLVGDGWFLVKVKGSHHHFKHLEKKGKVTLPHPKKNLPTGTLRSIAKQAGLTWPLT